MTSTIGAPDVADRPIARRLAAFAVEAAGTPLPDEVTRSVGQRVLDVLGICVASYRLDTSTAVGRWIGDQGGRPEAHGVGLGEPVPAGQAALLNGVLAHSLDYDDTHLPSVLHPSASVIPAALAAAEANGSSGRETTRAIAAGIEITVRAGMAGYDEKLGNSVYFEHGQHATSICGTIGSAVAAALLYGLDTDAVMHAIGLSTSMASGIIEGNRTGGTVKRMHCGWAAHAGVSAAALARHGLTGPPTAFEGRFGFLRAFLRGEADIAQFVDGLGTRWSVPGIFFKPYPANHFTHTIVDAGIRLRERGLRPDDIEQVEVRVPHAVVRTVGEPLAGKRAPRTGYEAQFSAPYAFAAGLLGGGGLGVGLADYTDALATDELRRAVMATVEVVGDQRCDEIFPAQFPSIVRVRTRSSELWTEEVLANRGGPERPLSNTELGTKFDDNVGGRLDPGDAATVRRLALGLDDVPDLRRLMIPLARARRDP